MNTDEGPNTSSKMTPPDPPTGGVPLNDERLVQLAFAWQGIARQLRTMDTVDLGEVEPAVIYGWRRD